MNLPHHLVLVASTYHFRMKAPADLVPLYQKRYLKHSLKTGDIRRAKELAYSLTSTYLEDFRRMRAMRNPKDEAERLQQARSFLDGIFNKETSPSLPVLPPEAPKAPQKPNQFELEPTTQGWGVKQAKDEADYQLGLKEIERRERAGALPVIQAAAPAPSIPQAHVGLPSMPLSIAIEWFYKKKTGSMKEATLLKHITNLREFLAFHRDCEVSTIQNHHLDAFREHLKFKVKNSTPTIKNKFSSVGQMFKALKAAGFYQRESPTTGQVVYSFKEKRQRHKDHGKLTFSADEIAKIFEPTIYTKKKIPSEYWVPLIQLYTGCRANEICQLAIVDFLQVDGFECFRITDDGEDGSVKTEATKRVIPIHHNLLKLGLLEYVERLKNEGATRIFPYLKCYPNNNRYGGKQVKAFVRHLNKVGIGTMKGRKASHSFRSTLIQKLQDYRVSKEVRKDYVGHSSEDGQDDFMDSHSLNYSRVSYVKELADIVLPCLDFSIDVENLKVDQFKFKLT
ncbi:MAG: site-specific integrase [Pseudomonadota bacterium]